MTENTVPNPTPTAPTSNGGSGWWLALIVIIILIVAGYIFFSKPIFRKPSTQTPTTETPTGDQTNTGETGFVTPPADNSGTGEANATSTATTTVANPDATAVKTFTINAKNFAFDPKTITVNRGDRVKLIVNNIGGTHDLVIDALKIRTPRIQDGQTAEVNFTADQIGNFGYYCSVGEHRAMGMWGTLIVK